MNANRLSDIADREPTRGERREDVLRLVRQRLSQSPRVVRLSRTGRATDARTPVQTAE